MSEVSDEDKNTPFDDVTHWVGNLHHKSMDSTERTIQRGIRWKTKSDILSKELGVAQKQQTKSSLAHRFFSWR